MDKLEKFILSKPVEIIMKIAGVLWIIAAIYLSYKSVIDAYNINH